MSARPIYPDKLFPKLKLVQRRLQDKVRYESALSRLI